MPLRVVLQDSKHAGERRQRGFDITIFCTNFWQSGISVSSGWTVRPEPRELPDGTQMNGLRGPDGYQYRAANTGGTGKLEPVWGDNVLDGSISWIREPLSSTSLFKNVPSVNSIEWLHPDEMTIDGTVLVNGAALQIAAYFSGGVEGETHRTIARVTFDDGSIEDFAIDWQILETGVAS
jgi:hypothetical protein